MVVDAPDLEVRESGVVLWTPRCKGSRSKAPELQAASLVLGDADPAMKDVNSHLGLHAIYTYLFMSVFDACQSASVIFLLGFQVLVRAWLLGAGCGLGVCTRGLMGGLKVTAVGRWVAARGLSGRQTRAQGSGVGDLDS